MRSLVRPKRPLVVAAVLLTALVTLWLFVPTVLGHFAVFNSASISATPTGATVADDGQSVEVAFEIHNPTSRSVQLSGGHVNVYDGDTRLSDGTTMRLSETTVQSGETKTVTGTIALSEGLADRTRRAVETGELRYSGELDAAIGDHTFTVAAGGDEE